jgi:DNA mismatch repair protein MutS
VVEYIHNSPRLGCKTLFATHYHELTQLAGTLPRVRNHTVAVSEDEGQVIFLHRIVPGGADKSYGIHVAQLAGLPRAVTNRAWEVLKDLEGNDGSRDKRPKTVRTRRQAQALQMPLFGADPSPLLPLLEELLQMDVPNMTPLEAINKLYELQKKASQQHDKGD